MRYISDLLNGILKFISSQQPNISTANGPIKVSSNDFIINIVDKLIYSKFKSCYFFLPLHENISERTFS